jgi:hypothetical protein
MLRARRKSFQMVEIWVAICATEKPPAWLALTRPVVCRSIRVV